MALFTDIQNSLKNTIFDNKRKEKDAIYMKEDFSDEDGVRAAELEGLFAELGGWDCLLYTSFLFNNSFFMVDSIFGTCKLRCKL